MPTTARLVSGVAQGTVFGRCQCRVDHLLGDALLGHPLLGVVTVTKSAFASSYATVASTTGRFPGSVPARPTTPSQSHYPDQTTNSAFVTSGGGKEESFSQGILAVEHELVETGQIGRAGDGGDDRPSS